MSALPNGYELAPVMALPSGFATGAGAAPLDLISNRTSRREQCPNSFALCGENGVWAVLVNVPCKQWSCRVCGERKAQRYAGIARRGCDLAHERIRLLTVTSPRETPEVSWRELPGRWDKVRKRLARYLGRPLEYFGSIELQRRGNPHPHFLLRDSGYIPKPIVHSACSAAGFGFSDIRQIAAGAGIQYVTKYLHKSAGQEMPKGIRRIRRSRGWLTELPTIKGSWGSGWVWQSVEGQDGDFVEAKLRARGVLEVFRYDQRVDVAASD